MAIAYDASSAGQANPVTSHTVSHICSGSNRVLIVGVVADKNIELDTITGATYNGVAMTLLQTLSDNNGSDRRRYLFYLSNPASGTNDIVVSASASINISIQAVSYTGCLQDVADASGQGSSASSSTTYASSLTTIADNCWVIAMVSSSPAGTYTAGANTIFRVESFNAIYDSNAPVTPAGSRTLNYISSSSGTWGNVMVSIAPAAVSDTGNFLGLLI